MTAEGLAPGPYCPVTTGVGSIRGAAGNVVTGTDGPVNVYNNWFGQYRDRRRPWELDVEQQRLLAEVFVEPPGWDDATAMVRNERIVLLAGERGIGKRAAALRLLFGLRADNAQPMHELQPDFDELEQSLLDPHDVDEASLLLLDLSAADGVASARALRELPTVIRVVRERNAHLAVLLPDDHRGGRFPEWDPQSVRLERPDNEQVLRRHLGRRIEVPRPLPERLASELRSAEPSRVAVLARLAVRTSSEVPDGDPASWIEAARRATFDRAGEVAQLVGKHTAAGPRALMLAAALFDGTPATVVAEAERRFLATIDHSTEPVPVIECDDLGSRLADIGAEIRSDGRVAFTELNQAAALRAHFWTHFPLLHEHFRDWIGGCGDLMTRAGADIAGRVPRFVDECLRVGRHQDVVDLVEKWTDSQPTLPAALPGNVLAYALSHPRHGWLFRRRCYQWAAAGQTSVRLADLVVTACRDVVAPTHPRQAIVRLRHLAGHAHPAVADAARQALALVVDGRAAHLRYFLERSSTARDEPRRIADALCFVTLVGAWPGDPRTIAGDGVVRARVVARWHDVFALPVDRWQSALRRWLAAEATGGAAGDRLLSVLVDATGCHPARVASLEDCARRWGTAADDPAAGDVVHRLVAALDTAVVESALAVDTGPGRPEAAGTTEMRGVPDEQAG